jgi:2-dehydro-3-deoxyphosphooctonate aldolase (KDO 8-P synthase)
MEPKVPVGDLLIGGEGPLFLIAGPCVIETEEITLEVADFLREIKDLLHIPVIFKTSFDKANRTSLDSYRGPGIDKGLEIIRRVKEKTGLPVLSDIHSVGEVAKAAQVLDVLQIPAFLCRQTDLLVAAARTGLALNIKKGQFLSPWDMAQVVGKVASCGNRRLLLTERGTSFGYNNLVVDIRSIAIMKNFGFPVVFDATHSVQLPGGAGSSSGGQREFIGHLSRAAVAAGADGVFMEVHPHPESALCDGPNSIPLGQVRSLVSLLQEIKALVSGQ